jgi:hypothetical protein
MDILSLEKCKERRDSSTITTEYMFYKERWKICTCQGMCEMTVPGILEESYVLQFKLLKHIFRTAEV